MGKATAGGPVPKPRVKPCEKRTYNYPACSRREIKTRVLLPKLDMVYALLQADRPAAMIFRGYC